MSDKTRVSVRHQEKIEQVLPSMTKTPKTFYRYRTFSTTTLDTLCNDTVYFSNPGSFNDPLDCNPTLECDSPIEDLRNLLAFLVEGRVKGAALRNLKRAFVKGNGATRHAKSQASNAANSKLADIAYHATNPDYGIDVLEAEAWLLVQEIECELHQHYERGVCCFSSSYKNPLLWSHYGDQHKGICVGYGVERDPAPELNKVVYGGDRAIQTSTLMAAFLEKDVEAKNDLDRAVFLRKARGWDYEREWRLIGNQGVQDSPLLLKEVVFGLRCTNAIKHTVVTVLSGRDNDVKFFEIHSVRGSYALRRGRLDRGELSAFLPKTAMSGVEIFGPATG